MLKSILRPSGFSFVVSVFLMGLIIFAHQVPSIERYLQIPADFSILRLVSTWLDHTLTSAIGETRTQTLVVGLFWAGVGLGVYIFLRGISRFATEFSESFDERQYIWPKGADRNQAVSAASHKIGFQILAFIALLILTFGPLERILAGPVWQGFIGPSLALQLSVWFVAGCVVMHFWSVVLRLALLKTRVFA